MTEALAYVEHLGRTWRAETAPVVVSRILPKSEMAACILHGKANDDFLSDALPRDDGYLVGLQLDDCPDHEYWEGDRKAASGSLRAGDTVVYDLSRDPRVRVGRSLHAMQFYLPRSALDAIAEDAQVPRIAGLTCNPGVGLSDPVVRNLAASIMAAFDLPNDVGKMFIERALLALVAHLARSYGGMEAAPSMRKGGLAPWQERRAKEMLTSDLRAAIPIKDVAKECRLSISHFSRAFRQSLGLAPHQWLLMQRVAAAKSLLREGKTGLSEVALSCGFADQSHFTRVFSREVGCSPGIWRRSLAAAG